MKRILALGVCLGLIYHYPTPLSAHTAFAEDFDPTAEYEIRTVPVLPNNPKTQMSTTNTSAESPVVTDNARSIFYVPDSTSTIDLSELTAGTNTAANTPLQSKLSQLFSTFLLPIQIDSALAAPFHSPVVRSTIDSFFSALNQTTTSPLTKISLLLMLAVVVMFLFFKAQAIQTVAIISTSMLAAADIALHIISKVASVIQSAIYHQKSTIAYQANKKWIGLHLSRDIGDVKEDLKYIGTTVVVSFAAIAIIYVGATVVMQVAPRLTLLSRTLPPNLTYHLYRTANQTVQECTNIPVACDTPYSFAFTTATNFLLGSPKSSINIVTKGISFIDDETNAIVNVANNASETRTIATAANNVDDTVKTAALLNSGLKLTDDLLEQRLGTEFITKHFGSTSSTAFQTAKQKYPNTFRLINENHGHIIKNHLTDESFQISRVKSGKVITVSTFNSVDDMLESIEKTVTDPQNIQSLTDWEKSSGSTSILELHKKFDANIGKNYKLINNELVIKNSNEVTLNLVKRGDEVIINTGYPSDL